MRCGGFSGRIERKCSSRSRSSFQFGGNWYSTMLSLPSNPPAWSSSRCRGSSGSLRRLMCVRYRLALIENAKPSGVCLHQASNVFRSGSR